MQDIPSTSSRSFKARGGARIGWVNYSWPLADLRVTEDRLTVTTTMFGLFNTGSYTFTRDQVIAIDRHGVIPLIGEGIKIQHLVTNYPRKIIFWCRPTRVLEGIASVGFPTNQKSPDGQPYDSITAPLPSGFPLRWPPVIAFILLWNLLGGLAFLLQIPRLFGPLAALAVGTLFAISFGGLTSV